MQSSIFSSSCAGFPIFLLFVSLLPPCCTALNLGHGSEGAKPNHWTAREFLSVVVVVLNFDHATEFAGSQFPDQGQNPGHSSNSAEF